MAGVVDDHNIPSALPLKPDHAPSPIHVPGAVFLAAVVAFLWIIPLQAPELVVAKGWELLHLLLIAIAVSCGLFSGKYSTNPGTGVTGHARHSKGEASQARVGFSEDSEEGEEEEHREREGESASDSGWTVDLGRTQFWSSLYHRPDPAPLVTEEELPGTGGGRSLCLPVRSLRSHVLPQPAATLDRSFRSCGPPPLGGPCRERAYAQMTTPEETEGEEDEGEDEEDTASGGSPIPWRSQSARMIDTRADLGSSSPPTPNSGGTRAPYLRCASTGNLAASQFVPLDHWSRRMDPVKKKGKLSKPYSPPSTPPSRRASFPDASAWPFPSMRQVRSRIPKDEPEVAPDRCRGRPHPSHTREISPSDAHDSVVGSDRSSGSGDSSNEEADQRSAASGSSTVTDASEEDERISSPTCPGPAAGRNEVDRKAEEFIARIRKQIQSRSPIPATNI